MDKTLNLTNHFPAWSCVQNWRTPSSAILTTCKLETSTFTYNQFQAPRHYSLTYFRPSFHGVQFFFFFLSFDKGQWANAGKRLLKWGKLLSLRWYVQRKSPNFTDVGMVTMVRGTRVCSPFVEGEALGTETAYIPYIDCHFHIVIGHETKRAL